MLRRVLFLPLLALLLAVTGCGGNSKSADKKPGTGASATASAGASSSSDAAGLPTVKGALGEKPTITFPSKTPPTTQLSQTLTEGTGKPVAKGDLLVGDYLGQIWQGNVFDSSYDRKAPAGFVIGVKQVVPGWDAILVGVKVGSRVVMSLPPAAGYGAAGNAQAGIKGTDTLVFVVDVLGSYGKQDRSQPAAVVQKVSTPGITVTGAPGAIPTVTIQQGPRKTALPTKPSMIVLARGTGAPVGPGALVVQYVGTFFTGATAGSTYAEGAPKAFNIGSSGATTPFDLARGVPVGSRVLLILPGANGQPAAAVAVDLVAQPTSLGKS